MKIEQRRDKVNELQIFNNPQFGQVRTVTVNKTVYFVANDVASALGYANPKDAIYRHCKGAMNHVLLTNGGEQTVKVIKEGDIYRLVIKSQLPSAQEFESWIFDDVLPSIRKHGMYATDELLDNPDLLIAAATKLKEERAARLAAEKKVEELKPAAEFYHTVAESKDAIAIGDAAKVLNMGLGRNRLFEILRKEKILMSNNTPYQEFIDRGYFRTIEQKWTTPEGETRISIKTLVYQKGLNYIRRIVQSA